jgi:penicillin-binding protein 2
MANGGVWFKPHLVKMAAPADPRKENWNLDNIAKVVSGMYGVVNEAGGTGDSARIAGITVSGKTGSAQRVSNDFKKSGKADDDDKDNGWFVAFAPRENPEIVLAVLLEGGEHGALAAPTARDIIKAYFDKKVRLSRIAQPTLALIQKPGQTVGQAILSPVASTAASDAASSSEDH